MNSEPRPFVPTLTLQHFIKTHEGQELISSQKPFCIQGGLYQGFNQSLVTCQEKQMTDEEIEAAYDVDNSKEKVWEQRRRRGEARVILKDREMAEREAIKRARERDELELEKLRADLGRDKPQAQQAIKDQIAALTALLEDPAPADPVSSVACEECGETSPDGHKKPKMWLRGHNMKHARAKKKKA